jgi:integrative and conjugative element protein (TIGR02256 family)
VLTRQNFTLEDIGASKADALLKRLLSIAPGIDVQAFAREAHGFVLEQREQLSTYDIVIDCTASANLQMKLERDWLRVGSVIRHFASFVIDARAQRFLAVSLGPAAVDGPWSAYQRLKYRLCMEDDRADLVTAFYTARAREALFQPEPGCSDPTFSGSTADVMRLTATALNGLATHIPKKGEAAILAGSLQTDNQLCGDLVIDTLSSVTSVVVGDYRLLITRKALNQARAFVRQNSRSRSSAHETGGLLWGYWDDASRVIVILDASGPPPDSQHDPGHFVCGTEGCAKEHDSRMQHSHGVCGFVGLWHTHPGEAPRQSLEDRLGMSGLVARFGQNRRRAVMLIFGRIAGEASAGAYLYEAQLAAEGRELLQFGGALISLEAAVV